MRWFILILVLFALPKPALADDAVYYCTARLFDRLPKISLLHHASVVICNEHVLPYARDEKGRCVMNPDLVYYGTQFRFKGFQHEVALIDIKATRVNTPAAVVRERLERHDRKWNIIQNCQISAKWATSPPGKKTVWGMVLGKGP